MIENQGNIIIKKEKYNIGIVIRIIGVLLLFAFPVGTIIGIGLIVVGWKMSKIFACSECGNPVNDNKVKICPTCKVSFALLQESQ